MHEIIHPGEVPRDVILAVTATIRYHTEAATVCGRVRPGDGQDLSGCMNVISSLGLWIPDRKQQINSLFISGPPQVEKMFWLW